MDPANISWLETDPDDSYWEAHHRRGDPDRDRVRDFYAIRDLFEGNENAWDDLRRRERMAEAMYE